MLKEDPLVLDKLKRFEMEIEWALNGIATISVVIIFYCFNERL